MQFFVLSTGNPDAMFRFTRPLNLICHKNKNKENKFFFFYFLYNKSKNKIYIYIYIYILFLLLFFLYFYFYGESISVKMKLAEESFKLACAAKGNVQVRISWLYFRNSEIEPFLNNIKKISQLQI